MIEKTRGWHDKPLFDGAPEKRIGPATGEDLGLKERAPNPLTVDSVQERAAQDGVDAVEAERRIRAENIAYHATRDQVRTLLKEFKRRTGLTPVAAKFEVWVGEARYANGAFVREFEDLVQRHSP